MGGDETRSSDEELYRKHGDMTAVEVKHYQGEYHHGDIASIRARLVPQCRVVLYYSTGGSSGTVGNTGYTTILASVIVVNQLW